MQATNWLLHFFYPPTLMRDILEANLTHKYTRKGILETTVQPRQADLLQSYHKEEEAKYDAE